MINYNFIINVAKPRNNFTLNVILFVVYQLKIFIVDLQVMEVFSCSKYLSKKIS